MNKLQNKQSLVSLIITIVNQEISNLDPNKSYTAEELLGKTEWNQILPVDTHKQIGRTLSNLVKQERLPLMFSGYTTNRHNQYRLIKTSNP